MPKRTFTGFGGIDLVADEFGSADLPTVLLLGGGGQSREVWRTAAETLASAGRHVVSIDLRGHGDSGWAKDGRYDLNAFVGDLYSVLRELPSRPVIVGASLGGWIAITAIGEGEPDLASGLVLVDSPAQIDPNEAQAMGDALRRRATATGRKPTFDPEFTRGINLAEVEERFTKALNNIKVPALIMHGAQSDLSSAETINSLAALIDGSEMVTVEGAGHLIAVDQPDDFNAILLEFLERRVPRTPPEYVSGSEPRVLRDALGCFATGITVVTTTGKDGVPVGLTANSFTSVSMDPPLLLVCPAKNAGSLPAFEESDHFAVNVLHIGQQPVSNLFASRGEDRFASTDWEYWDNNVPIINNSLASFECRKFAEYDGGDHVILVGEVLRVKFEPRRDPLLYFRGKYRRLHFA